jgi:hypothetical protein
LRAVERLGQRLTDLQWRWLDYGPFNTGLYAVENQLVASGRVRRTEISNVAGSPEYRFTLEGDVGTPSIEKAFWDIVQGVVVEYSSFAASTLRDITYQTPPMIEAQKGRARGVELDLDLVRPVPNVQKAVARLMARVGKLSPQETDEGAMEELAADMESMVAIRSRANREMLD